MCPHLSPQRIRLLVILLLALFPLVGMEIDLIAPSFPPMSVALHVPAAFTKNLISSYLLAYGLSCFIFGFLSDAWGRQKILLSGLLVFALVSMMPVIWPRPDILLIARILQGVSLAAFALNVRPVIGDILPSEKAMPVFVLVSLMWGIGPILGPFIGGYLQVYFGWQACFIFFAIYSLLGFLALIPLLPETHLDVRPLSIKKIGTDLLEMSAHRRFVGIVLFTSFSYTLIIAFNVMGPFLFQTGFGFSPIGFGHIALLMGCSFLIGTLICRRIIQGNQIDFIFEKILPFAIFLGLCGVVLAAGWKLSSDTVVILNVILFLCYGMINPAALGLGMTLFPKRVGTASALIFLFNFLITGLSAFLLSFINADHVFPLTCVDLILMIICGATYWFFMRSKDSYVSTQ